jgi:hypothetical protein
MTHNGWTNYETWATGMFLDGNYTGEGTYRAVLNLVEQVAASDLQTVAGVLEDFVTDEVTLESASLAADFVQTALSEVNWTELASHKSEEIREKWESEAQSRGGSDARGAATWTVDGNTGWAHARKVLTMIQDGDPAVDDCLPRRPDLSGEFADELTPDRLAEEVTGQDAGDIEDELVDRLATAYEYGVSETFEHAVERELMLAVGDLARCGGCGGDVNVVTEKHCPHCGYPDGNSMLAKGWKKP